MTDALREAVFPMTWRALQTAKCCGGPGSPCPIQSRDSGYDCVRIGFVDSLIAENARLRTALQEPAPAVAREPTPKMMLAGATALYGEEEARDQACRDAAADCWYAMYDAAAQAPVEPAPVVQPSFIVPEGSSLSSLVGPIMIQMQEGHMEQIDHVIADARKWRAAAPSQLVEDARRYQWVIHNGGLLNEWPREWKPSRDGPLIPWIEKRIDAAIRSIAKGVES